jgi:hypothetical protein
MIKNIEANRMTKQGLIEKQDDLEWEAYLQLHNLAEELGLLEHDKELIAYLNKKLAHFEEKYEVIIEEYE